MRFLLSGTAELPGRAIAVLLFRDSRLTIYGAKQNVEETLPLEPSGVKIGEISEGACGKPVLSGLQRVVHLDFKDARDSFIWPQCKL